MKNRKRNRKIGYDYSQNNLYFVTCCVNNMECCFGDVIRVGTGRDLSLNNAEINNSKMNNPERNEAEMILNEYGIIANNQLEWLQIQYPYIELHSYQVMPNHIHAVIEINSLKVNSIDKTGNEQSVLGSVKIKSLSQIMGAYKTTSSKKIHLLGNDQFIWQRSFYDHIIRDERSYQNIMNYIENNPNCWNKDKFYKN